MAERRRRRAAVLAAHLRPAARARGAAADGRAQIGSVSVSPRAPARRVAVHYGDGPGRGEVTRMLLAVGGVPYDDYRYAGASFAALTRTAPGAADPTGGSPFPFNQMPALEVDGVMYAQTSSIARFAARLAGLYPDDPVDALKSDEIFEHTGEIQYSTTPLLMDGVPGRAGTKVRPKAERIAAFTEWSKTRLPVMMAQLDRLLGSAAFFCGDVLTWADVAVFNRLENLTGIAKVYGVDVLPAYPTLAAHSRRVAAVPAVAAYLAARERLMAARGTAGKSAGTYGGSGHYRCTSSGWRRPSPCTCSVSRVGDM